jgi:hypothetical protein
MAWKLPGFGSKEPDPNYKPTADDFKGESVANTVLKDALQHPATIYPAALSVLSVFWTVVVNPSPQSIGAACLFAFVSASAFVWNYVVKGPEKAAAHVVQLREQRSAFELHSLDELKTACELAGYVEGAKEVGELKTAYSNLTTYLKEQKKGDSLDRFRLLAEDTFRQGVRVLEQALDIFKALSTVNTKTLNKEIKDWKREKELRADDESPASKALDTQIAAHEKRLELYDRSLERLAELIAQVNEIEAALETTHLEMVDLGSKDPTTLLSDDGGAANRLKRAVTAARKVEDRLRGNLDADDAAMRDKYLKAADEQ